MDLRTQLLDLHHNLTTGKATPHEIVPQFDKVLPNEHPLWEIWWKHFCAVADIELSLPDPDVRYPEALLGFCIKF